MVDQGIDLDRSGEKLRDYTLLNIAGRGAFAIVYRAEHQLLEQIRAIKIIHPQHLTDPDLMQRFKEEAQLVAKLRHTHIVTLHDFWIDESGAYIAMQWMRQGTLEELLKNQGSLSPEETARIFLQIAPALSLVHSQQIVHRDLKPANILFDAINSESDQFSAHIADFGLAKLLRVPLGSASQHNIIGTPAYIPPEQADPSMGIPVTARSDIYSLGIILYEMLAGERPFGNAGVVEAILHHLRDPLPLLHEKKPDLPAVVDEVIQKATAKHPEDRFEDVLTFAEAFHSAVQQTPVPTHFLSKTSTFPQPQPIKAVGDLHARIYTKSGAVLENPRRLIGREDLIGSIDDAIADNAHVLLHGMAGIGKTSIAGRIASQYLDHTHKQVIWIELGKQDANALFEALAYAIDQYPVIAVLDNDECIVAMREMLLELDALIVVDNIWNEQAILPIIRAVPHTMPLLMTSRIAFSIDGPMFDIGALSESDAITLLDYHARGIYNNNESAKHLCKVLGYHPFAIEMAGKRLKIYRHLTPDRLIQDIRNSPHSLVVTGVLGVDKQRNVKELLDDSIDILSDKLRNLIISMGGLYTPRASIDLLADITGIDSIVLQASLGELERYGLLYLTMDADKPYYYRLHDLTYSYTMSLFKSEIRDTSLVIDGIKKFVNEKVGDYDALKFDLMNILGAARTAYHRDDMLNLIAIMRPLIVDANYLTARGPTSTALEMVKTAIEAAQRIEDYESAFYFAGKLGNVYFQITSQFKLAAETYTQAFEFAQKLGDYSKQAVVLSLIGTSRFNLGEQNIEWYYEQASMFANSSGDPRVKIKILENRSFHANEKSPPDYEASRDYCNDAIQIAEEHDLEEELFGAILNRSKSESQLGLKKDALQSSQTAYDIAKRANNYNWLMLASKALAWDFHCSDHLDHAAEYYKEAYSWAIAVGNVDMQKEILEQTEAFGYLISEKQEEEYDEQQHSPR